MLSGPRQWHASEQAYSALSLYETIRHHRGELQFASPTRWRPPGRHYSTPLGRCISNAYRIGPCADLACRFMNILSRGWPRSSSPQHEGKAIWPHVLVLRSSFTSPSVAFHARVFRRRRRQVCGGVTYRLHHLSRSSSFIHSRPSPCRSPRLPHVTCHFLTLASFILFTHTRARARIHLPSLFLPFLHRRFISANVAAARAHGTSIVQKCGRTIYSVICGFTHCCRNRTV